MIDLIDIKYCFYREVYGIINRKYYNNIIKKLHTIPIKHWAEISNKLNSRIDTGFLDDVIPEWLNKIENKNRQKRFRLSISIIDYIDCIIGRRESLRYHHVVNLNRTQKDFNEWWNKHLEYIHDINV